MFICMVEVQCKLSCPGLIRTINSISLQLKSANRKMDDSWTNWQPIDWAADCDYWGSLGRKPVPGANCPVGLFGAQSTTNCSSFREAQINPLRYRHPVPPTFSTSSSQLSFLAGPLSPRRSNAFWPESVARSSGFCSVSGPWKQSPDRGRHNLYDRPLPEHADRLKIGIGQRSQLN